MTGQLKDVRDGSTCRSCGAAVFWVLSPNGKRMPVDKAPTPAGPYVLTYSVIRNELQAKPFKPPGTPERNRFESHFKTCPNASQHSKAAK